MTRSVFSESRRGKSGGVVPYNDGSPGGLQWHNHRDPNDAHPTSCTACAFRMVVRRLEATEKVLGLILRHQRWEEWAREIKDNTLIGKQMAEAIMGFVDLRPRRSSQDEEVGGMDG